MLRNILLGLGVFAALMSILIFSGKFPIGSKKVAATGEVMLWGTIPEESMNPIVQQFNAQNQSYRVSYKEVNPNSFNQTLLEALANGTGPDLILAPHQILLANASRISPFPISSFSEKSYKDTYVDGASLFFTAQGPLALPVSIDPLVLFYNRSLFSKHGLINPPTYWDEVLQMTQELTIPDTKGGFVESAIALGAPNTSNMKDILMAVVGQLGQVPTLRSVNQDGSVAVKVTANNPKTTDSDVLPLATAARFFTQFADPSKNSYTWNQYSSSASDQFVAEKLAMYIGYSSEFPILVARNPKGEFEMAYLPQTRGYNTFVTGGQMFGIATLKTSKNPVTAFTVEAQFSSAPVALQIAARLHAVPAFRSYAATEGLSEVIAKSMLVARPWYDSFFVQSTTLVATMLSDILSGRVDPTSAAESFVSRLQDLYTPL